MQGLIFIPDISGFTNFVKSIDIDLGVTITRDLLNVIIDNNPLDLDLSEIEGDAVLFYKIGKPICLKEVMNSFNNMYEAFDNAYQRWKRLYSIEADLSLKLIVHYGNIMVYDIKGFKKLYGETVIDSHGLLKNGHNENDYILVTEDYVKALQQDISEVLLPGDEYRHYKSQLYTGVKRIPYHFLSTTKKASYIPALMAKRQRVLNEDMYMAIGI
jgi:hypothetical protein